MFPLFEKNREGRTSRKKSQRACFTRNPLKTGRLKNGRGRGRPKGAGFLWALYLTILPGLTGCFWNQKQKTAPGLIDMNRIAAGNSAFLLNKLEGTGHLNYEGGIPRTFTLHFQTCVKDAVKRDSSVPLNTKFEVVYETAEKNADGSYKKITKRHETGANEGGCIHWSEEYPYRYVIKSRWIGLNRTVEGGERSFYQGKTPVGIAVNPWLFESGGTEALNIIDMRPLYYDQTVDILKRYTYDENGLDFLTSKNQEYPQLWAPNIAVQISLSEDRTGKISDSSQLQTLKKEIEKKERELSDLKGKAFSAGPKEKKLNEDVVKAKKNEIEKLKKEVEIQKLKDLIESHTAFCGLKGGGGGDCYTRRLQMVLTIPLELRTLDAGGKIQRAPVTGGSYNVRAYLTAKQRGKKPHYQLHTESLYKRNVRQGGGGESAHQSVESLIVDFSAGILFIDFNATYKLVIEVESVDQPFKKFQGIYTLDDRIKVGPRQKGVEMDNWLAGEYELLLGKEDFKTKKEIDVIRSLNIQSLFDQSAGTQEETIRRLRDNEFHSTHLEVQVNDSSIKFSNVKTGETCSENENVIERTIEYKATACFKDFFIKKPEGIPFRIIVENPRPKPEEPRLKELSKITNGRSEFYETNTDGCIEWTDELKHKNYNRQIYIERKIHFLSKNGLHYGQVRIGLNPWQGAFQFGRNLTTASEDKIRTERTGVRHPRLVINQTRSVNFFPSYLIDKLLNINIAHNFYFLFQVIISRHDDIAEGRHPRGREFIRDGYHLIRLLIMRSPVEVGVVPKVRSVKEYQDRLSSRLNDNVETPFIGGKYLSHVDTVINVKGNWVNIYVPTQFNQRQFVYLASRNQMSMEIYPADPRGFVYKKERVAKGEDCELDPEKTTWKPYFHCRDLGLQPHESGDCHELVSVPYTSPFQTNDWVNWNPVRPARFKALKTEKKPSGGLPVKWMESENRWITDIEKIEDSHIPLRWSESEKHLILDTDKIINQSETGSQRKYFNFNPKTQGKESGTALASSPEAQSQKAPVVESRQSDCPVNEGFLARTALPSDGGAIFPGDIVLSDKTGRFVTTAGVEECFGDREAILAGGQMEDFLSTKEYPAGKINRRKSDKDKDHLKSFADENSLKIVDLSEKETEDKFIADLNETGEFFREQSKETARLLSERSGGAASDLQAPRAEGAGSDPSALPPEGTGETTDTLFSAVQRLFDMVGKSAAEEIKNEIESQCKTEEKIGLWRKMSSSLNPFSSDESSAVAKTTWGEAAQNTRSYWAGFSSSDFFLSGATAPFAEYFNECSLRIIRDRLEASLERHAEESPLSDDFMNQLDSHLERNGLSEIYQPGRKSAPDSLIKRAYMIFVETNRERLKSIVDEGITAKNYKNPVNGSFIHNLCGFWFEKYFSDYLESRQMVSAYTRFIKKFNYNEILENKDINYGNFDREGLLRFLGMDDPDSPGKCVREYTNCLLNSSCDASLQKCESRVEGSDSCRIFLQNHCRRSPDSPLCRDGESFSKEYLCQGKMKLHCEQNPSQDICRLYGDRCGINRENCVRGLTEWFDGIRTEPVFSGAASPGDISSFPPYKTCLANPFEFFRFERKMAVLELDNSFRYLNGAGFNFSVSGSHSINSAMRWSGQNSGSFSLGPDIDASIRRADTGDQKQDENPQNNTSQNDISSQPKQRDPGKKRKFRLSTLDLRGRLNVGLKTGVSTSFSNNGGRDISIRIVDGVYLTVHRAAIEMGVRRFQKCLVIKPRPNAFFSFLNDEGLRESYSEGDVWRKELAGNDMKKIALTRPGLLLCNPIEERTDDNLEKITEHYYYVFQEVSRNMEFLFLYDVANRPYTMVFRGQNEFFKYFSLLRELREGRNSKGSLYHSQNDIPVNLFVDYPYPVEEVIGLNYSLKALNETGFHQGIYSYPDREYLNVDFFKKETGAVRQFLTGIRETTSILPPHPYGEKAPVQPWRKE